MGMYSFRDTPRFDASSSAVTPDYTYRREVCVASSTCMGCGRPQTVGAGNASKALTLLILPDIRRAMSQSASKHALPRHPLSRHAHRL